MALGHYLKFTASLELLKAVVAVCVLVLETEQKNVLATRYLMSTAEHVGDGKSLERRPSPWEELPSSPETFGVIGDYAFSDETDPQYLPRQQQSILTDTLFNQTVVASSFLNTRGMESLDSATVRKCELSSDDMLLDLDELVNDVIMDSLKLADFGLHLPSVSADDVESLLSSSTASTAASAAEPMSLEVGPSPVAETSVPVYCEQIFVTSPLGSETEAIVPSPVVENSFPVYHKQFFVATSSGADMETIGPSPVTENSFTERHEHVFVASPLGSDTELSSVTTTSLPAYEEQSPVSSPASVQSSVSTVTTEKKQRKKQQNKNAAQKYRQRKRGEQGMVMTEYEQLEKKNIELRTRVEEMTREVDYLKGLIEEICA